MDMARIRAPPMLAAVVVTRSPPSKKRPSASPSFGGSALSFRHERGRRPQYIVRPGPPAQRIPHRTG